MLSRMKKILFIYSYIGRKNCSCNEEKGESYSYIALKKEEKNLGLNSQIYEKTTRTLTKKKK